MKVIQSLWRPQDVYMPFPFHYTPDEHKHIVFSSSQACYHRRTKPNVVYVWKLNHTELFSAATNVNAMLINILQLSRRGSSLCPETSFPHYTVIIYRLGSALTTVTVSLLGNNREPFLAMNSRPPRWFSHVTYEWLKSVRVQEWWMYTGVAHQPEHWQPLLHTQDPKLLTTDNSEAHGVKYSLVFYFDYKCSIRFGISFHLHADATQLSALSPFFQQLPVWNPGVPCDSSLIFRIAHE